MSFKKMALKLSLLRAPDCRTFTIRQSGARTTKQQTIQENIPPPRPPEKEPPRPGRSETPQPRAGRRSSDRNQTQTRVSTEPIPEDYPPEGFTHPRISPPLVFSCGTRQRGEIDASNEHLISSHLTAPFAICPIEPSPNPCKLIRPDLLGRYLSELSGQDRRRVDGVLRLLLSSFFSHPGPMCWPVHTWPHSPHYPLRIGPQSHKAPHPRDGMC